MQRGGFVTGWFRYALWASGRSLGLILSAMGSLGRFVYGSDLLKGLDCGDSKASEGKGSGMFQKRCLGDGIMRDFYFLLYGSLFLFSL